MANYISGQNYDALMVPTKAATVFAAQETSLYMSGAIVPMIQVPAGSISAQVPVMGSVTAQTLSGLGDTDEGETDTDFTTLKASDTKNTITLDLFAARSVVRDFGGVDTDEVGRVLGNAIAKKVDQTLTSKMASLTEQEITEGNLDLPEISKAVGAIRGSGETGQLYGVVSTDAYANLADSIGAQAFAGGDFQTESLRTGFVGSIYGVRMFVSSYLNNTNIAGTKNPKMAIFSQDAMRGAMAGGVNLEIARRPEAVGVDIVASVAFGAGTVDSSRGRLIIDAA